MAEVYAPSACDATKFSVAPTVMICSPAVRIPAVLGVLVKVLTIILSEPLVMVTEEGSVIA
ncbi:hypothetical protein D3C85_1555670 [compost metagenome]